MNSYKIFIYLSFLILNLSCEDESSKNTSKSNLELNISVFDKPMNSIINYSLKNKLFEIRDTCYICFDLKHSYGRNKPLAQISVDSKKYLEIRNKLDKVQIDNNLKSIYFNECLIDGLEFQFELIINEKKSETFIQNYYHPGIDKVLALVNSLTPEEYKIEYNSEELIREYEECQNSNK